MAKKGLFTTPMDLKEEKKNDKQVEKPIKKEV